MRSSGITGVEVTGREPFGPSGWERVRGTVTGGCGPGDGVVGLDTEHTYEAAFELVGPAGDTPHGAVLVDVENRGNPAGFGLVQPEVAAGQLAYARVQWQTGIAAGVPGHLQGVGLVILRDFGRWLAPRFGVRVLAGMSQSAWCVNTFVAEGFNEDPDRGGAVYGGAFSYLSGGNWLAVNRMGDDGEPPAPYARPNGVPIPASAILTRLASDPFLVEISSYTDYYRLRAGLTAASPLPPRARHYDFPSPHAPGTLVPPEIVFGDLGCNGGWAVPVNPTPSTFAVRATLLGLFHELGAGALPEGVAPLPPSAVFELGPAPPPGEHFNALPGVTLKVPLVDADAQPRGGVRFPDVVVPIGRPEPVALAPCGTSSITDVCGNFGGWQPFDAAELARRYGSVDGYAARYRDAYDGLVAQGFALASEREDAVAAARELFVAAPVSSR